MNDAAPTPRPSPRRSRFVAPPPRPARRLAWLAPFFLIGAAITLSPFFPAPADAGAGTGAAGGRPQEETVVLPATLPAPSAGSTVLSLPWGEDPGEVGLADPEGGERRGPEAFTVAPDGRIAVLDSVNKRLVVVAPPGAPAVPIPLDLRSPRFVAASSDLIHVLDADEDRLLKSFTWDGRLVATRALNEGEGSVTALLVDPNGFPLVEYAHERTAPVVDAVLDTTALSSATADRRGRPVGAGSDRRIGAGLGGDGHPRVEERDAAWALERSWDIDPGARASVDHLVSLDADADGRVVLGMRLRDLPAGQRGVPGSLLLTRLGDAGGLLLLSESLYAYLGQPYIVGGEGRVYAPVADPDGYRMVVHGFPEVTR
ncbi:MAG: hypothetical protein ACYC5Q_08125 [Thermoleophilia bacterium]